LDGAKHDAGEDSPAEPTEEAVPTAIRLPPEGRLLGVDFGTVRIGLAICDPSQTWVTPLDTYKRRGTKLDRQHFLQLAQQERLVGIVLGLPIHCDGKESQKSSEARDFGIWLSNVTECPVGYFDERFTTAEARRLLGETKLSAKKKKERLDGVAAHLILSHYLESSRSDTAPRQLDDQGD